jgi:hypothetical protein
MDATRDAYLVCCLIGPVQLSASVRIAASSRLATRNATQQTQQLSFLSKSVEIEWSRARVIGLIVKRIERFP